ncbi:unnamed protein product, partial [Hapterophycus canaliculatus]
MLNAGWQAAVVAIIAILLLSLLRRRVSAQMRYAVLCLALLKFAVPPFLIGSGSLLATTGVFSSGDLISVPSFGTEDSQVGLAVLGAIDTASDGSSIEFDGNAKTIATAASSESASNPHGNTKQTVANMTRSSQPRWLLLLSVVYACGVIASVIAVVRQFRRVRKFVRQATTANQETCQRAMTICERLPMKLPRILVSNNSEAPFATGVFRPAIVVPRTMIDDLEPDQLDIVLAHELVHIRRRDLLPNWIVYADEPAW